MNSGLSLQTLQHPASCSLVLGQLRCLQRFLLVHFCASPCLAICYSHLGVSRIPRDLTSVMDLRRTGFSVHLFIYLFCFVGQMAVFRLPKHGAGKKKEASDTLHKSLGSPLTITAAFRWWLLLCWQGLRGKACSVEASAGHRHRL